MMSPVVVLSIGCADSAQSCCSDSALAPGNIVPSRRCNTGSIAVSDTVTGEAVLVAEMVPAVWLIVPAAATVAWFSANKTTATASGDESIPAAVMTPPVWKMPLGVSPGTAAAVPEVRMVLLPASTVPEVATSWPVVRVALLLIAFTMPGLLISWAASTQVDVVDHAHDRRGVALCVTASTVPLLLMSLSAFSSAFVWA